MIGGGNVGKLLASPRLMASIFALIVVRAIGAVYVAQPLNLFFGKHFANEVETARQARIVLSNSSTNSSINVKGQLTFNTHYVDGCNPSAIG